MEAASMATEMPAAAVSRGYPKKEVVEVSPVSTTALTEEVYTESSLDPGSPSRDPETVEEAELGASQVKLSRERALALQLELMAEYSSPAFQKRLHELGRSKSDADSFNVNLTKLIRKAQASVIPRYGFDGSEQGAELMLEALSDFNKDPDVQVNAAAIKDLLSLEIPELKKEAPRIIQKPVTKFVVLDMLRGLFVEFSKAPFQADVRNLKMSADIKSGRVLRDRAKGGGTEDPAGYFHLKGRSELAFIIQEVLLPEYGFEPTKEGVLDMISHCAPFIQDPEVAQMLDQINEKLGMSPAACKRFRDLLRP